MLIDVLVGYGSPFPFDQAPSRPRHAGVTFKGCNIDNDVWMSQMAHMQDLFKAFFLARL